MKRAFGVSLVLAATVFLTGCPADLPVAPTASRHKADKQDADSTKAGADQDLGAQQAEVYTGRVLGLDGGPAADVSVKGYLISNNGGSIVSNNGSGYRVLADALITITDAEGRFRLASPDGSALNLEAVQKDDVKAIRMNVADGETDVTLQLAPTGTLSGHIEASSTQVTNFEGVDVFVPGTGYAAKAAADGTFTLANVPAGTFELVATKAGLGRGSAENVVVESEKTTMQNLVLSVAEPTILGLTPPNAGPGVELVITGEHFGASEGKVFTVTVGGAATAAPVRVDDTTIKVKVPAIATSGDVVVTVDGIASSPKHFDVIKTLSLDTGFHQFLVGGHRRYHVTALDAAGDTIASPTVSWAVDDAIGEVSADGTFTAGALGTGKVAIKSGDAVAECRVQVVDAPGVVNVVAGAGPLGYADGFGLRAQFKRPSSLVALPDGNLAVADNYNHRIRLVTPEGLVTTLAGSGNSDYKDGVGASADLGYPSDLAADADGNLYFSSWRSVRKLTPDGRVTTFAGAAEVAGNVDGAGGTARFAGVEDIAVAPDGTLYVVDRGNKALRLVSPDGTVTTLKDAGGVPVVFDDLHGVAIDETGKVFIAIGYEIDSVASDGARTLIAGGTKGQADGQGATAQFNYPASLTIGPGGDLYLLDMLPYDGYSVAMRKVTRAGVVTTVKDLVSDPDPNGQSIGVLYATDLTFDAAGDLYLVSEDSWVDDINQVLKLDFKP